MRNVATIVAGMALAVLVSGPVSARPPLGAGPIHSPRDYPGAPKPVYDDRNISPYAMNYTDEAAQALGFRDGHTDVFTVTPPTASPICPLSAADWVAMAPC